MHTKRDTNPKKQNSYGLINRFGKPSIRVRTYTRDQLMFSFQFVIIYKAFSGGELHIYTIYNMCMKLLRGMGSWEIY